MEMAEASEQLKMIMREQVTIKTEKLREILESMNFSFSTGAADETTYLKKEIKKFRKENHQLKRTIEKYQAKFLKQK